MNRYLDQLKSAKAPVANPPKPTQGPSVGSVGNPDSSFSKSKVVQSDGPFTPWHPPVSPNEVDRLHALIRVFAHQYRLSEEATDRIIKVAKRPPAATIPDDLRAFEREIAVSRCNSKQQSGRKA